MGRQINPSQLTLLQLSDTFFPSGSFALSHGLESLKQSGHIHSPADIEELIRYLLHFRIGSTDLVCVRAAYQASKNNIEQVHDIDRQLWAYSLVALNRETQRSSGRALLNVAREIWPSPQLEYLAIAVQDNAFHCLYPVVLGVASQSAGMYQWDTCLGYAHSFVTSMVSAAIRLGLCGHIQAQKILSSLAADIEQVCHDSKDLKIEELWSGVPALDIAQMLHPHRQQRLFKN